MPLNKIKFAKEELFKDFRKFDVNSDGKLSKNEIKLGYLKHYGRNVSDDELKKIF
jgi:Ca2+-binding EF-hand superfamily protein